MHCGRKIKHPQTSAQAAGFGVFTMSYESMFFGTILAGSAAFVLLEEPVKSGDTGKSCLDSNLGNGEVSVGQKFFSGFDASVT